MSLTAEQQKELAKFPPILRALVEAELAAGNSIVDVGHSFPAPPVGAYFKLANKVSTRPRASGNGLDFYNRDTSNYSGEFTDAKRFYFVLEPASPPPPEPDMNAIRKAADPQNNELTRLAHRAPGLAGLVSGLNQTCDELLRPNSSEEPKAEMERTTKPTKGPQLPPHSVLRSSTPTSASWLLHFRDTRPPQDIQFLLERDLMTLMPPVIESGKLVCRANVKKTGAPYSFLLSYDAALPKTNCYSLSVEASWAELP